MENYTILDKKQNSFLNDRDNIEKYLYINDYLTIEDFAKDYAIKYNNNYYAFLLDNINEIFLYYQHKNGIKNIDEKNINSSFCHIFFDIFKRDSFTLYKIFKKIFNSYLVDKKNITFKLEIIKILKLIENINNDILSTIIEKYSRVIEEDSSMIKKQDFLQLLETIKKFIEKYPDEENFSKDTKSYDLITKFSSKMENDDFSILVNTIKNKTTNINNSTIFNIIQKYSIKVNEDYISFTTENENIIREYYNTLLHKDSNISLLDIFINTSDNENFKLYLLKSEIIETGKILSNVYIKKETQSINIKQKLKISYSDDILTIYFNNIPKTYNLKTELDSLLAIINDQYIDLVVDLMVNYFNDILLQILYSVNESKYNLFYKLLNTIYLYIRSSINKDLLSPDNLLLFINNIEILIDYLLTNYPGEINRNKVLIDEIKRLKSQKIINIKKIKTLVRASNNTQKSLDIFYDGLNFEENIFKSDLPLLSFITESSISSYIQDIGETPYKVEDLTKIITENSILKTLTTFQILKYLFNSEFFIFSDIKDNSSINVLFHKLIISDDIIPMLIKLINEQSESINYFINKFKNQDKIIENELIKFLKDNQYKNYSSLADSLLELSRELSKFLENNTLSNFFNSLFEWYYNYHNEYQNINKNLNDIKNGFIAERTGNSNFDNTLSIIVDGKIRIAELEGKISYAKKLYSFFKLVNLVPDNNNIIKTGIKEIERKKEFEFDFWQKDALEFAKNNKSFILSGDTSGGKTSLAIALIEQFFKNSSVKMLFIVPTDPLAFQVYTNLMKTFQKTSIKPVIGIYTESLNIIKQDINILIGTPKDIDNILTLKDFSLYNEKEDLPLIFNNNKMFFDKIIIDEIHTMGNNYDKSIEGLKRAKCIQELLKCAKSSSQIIGFSATLSNKSIQNIKDFVYNNTNIIMENIIYTFNDIGKANKDSILIKPVVVQQKKYIINNEEGIDGIFKIKKGDKIKKINITGRFIFQMLKAISFWGKTPCAIFSGDEIETFDFYSRLIKFLEDGNNSCLKWKEFGNKFRNEPLFEEKAEVQFGLSKKAEKYNTVDKSTDNKKYDKFNDTWINLLLEQFNSCLKMSETEDNIPFDECSLIYDFNYFLTKRNIENFTSDRLKSISPEMYGLIYEIIHFEEYTSGKTFRKPFSGKHPYYRFIVNELRSNMFSPEMDKKLTRFGELLQIQKIDYSKRNPLVSLILTGISYGIGLITSTVPFAIQCEIVSYLHKSSLSDIPLPFIFCDDGMSMGINYSFVSTVILKDNLENISTSKYFQIKGRAGRRNYGVLNSPEVYLVNISNANSLDIIEDISLDDNNIDQFFYIPEKMISSVQNYILQTLNNTLPMTLNSYIELNIEELFPSRELRGRHQIRIMKLQVKELFDRLRNVCPHICSTYLSKLYLFLQNVEYEKIQQDL